MPKIVDHEKRKIEIAEATWKVIAEEGFENATVRKIAKAARLSVGSLRYYFPSQSELFTFSMDLVAERVEKRLKSTKYNGTPLEVLTKIISEVLPVDKDRRIEMEVWFVFSAKTLVDPKLKDVSDKDYMNMKRGFEVLLKKLGDSGLLREDIHLPDEIHRLHALVDGLAIHHLIHPELFTYDDMMNTLIYHLKRLIKMEESYR